METFYCISCDIFSGSHRSGQTCGAHRFTMTRTPPSLGMPTVGAAFSLKRSGSQLRVSRALSMRAQSLQLCPTLYNPVEWSLPGSSVHGILQARILEGVALPSSRGSFQPRARTHVSCITARFVTAEPLGKPHYFEAVLAVVAFSFYMLSDHFFFTLLNKVTDK